MPSQDGDAKITREDLQRLVGDIDDMTAVEILSLQPTIGELEEAVMWASGRGDVLGKAGESLTGVVAQIFDILTAGEEDEPPPSAAA